jgi:hypothetical protein
MCAIRLFSSSRNSKMISNSEHTRIRDNQMSHDSNSGALLSFAALVCDNKLYRRLSSLICLAPVKISAAIHNNS